MSFTEIWSRLKRTSKAAATGLADLTRWFTRNSFNKTVAALALIVLVLMIALGVALTLRFLSPKSQIIVSSFDIFAPGREEGDSEGKALADIVVDNMHQVLEQASGFHGNGVSSHSAFKPIPDMPEIPVETSYGLEIKGVSLDQLLISWGHLRYREFRVSGDLRAANGTTPIITLRYATQGEGKSYSATVPSDFDGAKINTAISTLTLQMLGDINSEVPVRYLLAQYFACEKDCGPTALEPTLQYSWHWTEREPQNAEPFFYLGYALRNTTNPRDALPFLDRALALNPKLDTAWNSKGLVFMDLGESSAARLSFNAALHVRRTPNPLQNLGVVAFCEGNYQEAEAYTKEAASLDHDDVGPLMNLALIKLYQSENAAAVQDYERALMLQPDNSRALLGLALTLGRMRKADQAISLLKMREQLQPDNAWPLVGEGIALLEDGKYDEAIKRLQVAKPLDHSDYATIQLGLTFLATGKLDMATAIFDQLLSGSNPPPEAQFFMSKVVAAQSKSQNGGSEAKLAAEQTWRVKTSLNVLEYQDLLKRR